jgi:general secretion pathway protein H
MVRIAITTKRLVSGPSPGALEAGRLASAAFSNLSRNSAQRGFTLIELMMVLVLIGIFTGLIVADMRGTYEDALLRSSARKLINACNLAANEAVTVGVPYRVMLDPVNHRFAIQRETQDQENQGKPAILEDGELDARIRIEVRETENSIDPEDEQPADNRAQENSERRAQIEFYSDGTADGRDIRLRDRTDVEMLLRINPSTGRIRIIKAESETTP